MNLSALSIRFNRVIAFAAVMILAAGLLSFERLGRLEDPEFTIKTAVVVAQWPGATADEMQRQVVETLENHIQEMGQIDHIRSESRPGECTIWVDIQESHWAEDLPQIWDELRRKVSEAQQEIPPEVRGVTVFDDFGDVYGILLAVTNDGHPHSEFRNWIDLVRRELLLVPEVARVELFGVQEEQIFIESSRARLSAQRLAPDQAIGAIQAQNMVVTGGSIELGGDRVNFYPTGTFDSLDDIREARIPTGWGESIRVGDISQVIRGFSDTPRSIMRFGVGGQGQAVDSIGVGVSIVSGGNVIRMGEAVRHRLADLVEQLPVGIEIHTVADQPQVVEESIGHFTASVIQAVVIVLAVLLFGLGLRVGVIVGFGIPLTILGTFIWMLLFHIDLQRASLGALIIVLGMVVDNSIVVSDLILVKLQRGMSKLDAVRETFVQASRPLMAATIVSTAAFMPIFLSPESVGEYLRSLFQVVGIALVMSWLVAFTITAVNCHHFLRVPIAEGQVREPHHGPIHALYRRTVEWVIRHRGLFLLGVYGTFFLALVGFGFVKQAFFPDAVRPQFTCEISLPEGSQIQSTLECAQGIERFLLARDDVEHVATFAGGGCPRFILTFSPPAANPSLAQLLVTTTSPDVNAAIMADLREFIGETYLDAEPRIALVAMGPSFNYEVALRISGSDPETLRDLSERVQSIMQSDPRCIEVCDDWRRRVPSIIIDVDQYRARRAGVSNRDIARSLGAIFSGNTIDVFREGTRRLPIIVRASTEEERRAVEMLFNAPIMTQGQLGASIPLRQIASPRLDWLDARIHRRDKRLTIQPQCNVIDGITPEEVRRDLVERIAAEIDFEHRYPEYLLEWGGEYESARDAQASTLEFFPAALGIMALVLIVKFNSFRRTAIIALYIPLCLIGVTLALLIFQQAFGFVALLGLMSLAGIMINNGIVLIDQIDQNTAQGMPSHEALVSACVSRLRPIFLSAATTVLGMLPLVLSGPFWRPMAVVIMSGLAVGTILTLGVVPSLYSLFFRVRPPRGGSVEG
jgi:multidrug efflux pump subunit AcrB